MRSRIVCMGNNRNRKHGEWKPGLVWEVGEIIFSRMEDEGFTQAQAAALLDKRKCDCSQDYISRILNADVEPRPHAIQGLFRLLEEYGIIQVPEGYDRPPITDYVLDLYSGRVSINTLETGQIADVKKPKKSANKGARRRSDRPRKVSKPIASIPEETLSESGAITVTIEQGVKLLKETIGDRSIEEIAAYYGIEKARIEKLLEGNKMPTMTDIFAMGPLFPGNNADPLLRAYHSES